MSSDTQSSKQHPKLCIIDKNFGIEMLKTLNMDCCNYRVSMVWCLCSKTDQAWLTIPTDTTRIMEKPRGTDKTTFSLELNCQEPRYRNG